MKERHGTGAHWFFLFCWFGFWTDLQWCPGITPGCQVRPEFESFCPVLMSSSSSSSMPLTAPPAVNSTCTLSWTCLAPWKRTLIMKTESSRWPRKWTRRCSWWLRVWGRENSSWYLAASGARGGKDLGNVERDGLVWLPGRENHAGSSALTIFPCSFSAWGYWMWFTFPVLPLYY